MEKRNRQQEWIGFHSLKLHKRLSNWFSILNTCIIVICTLGLTLWNLSCLEFKFDDTRLSYWHKNKIERIEIFFCCFLTLLIFCPVSWVSFAETSQQGRKLAKSGSNKKKIQFCQSYSYVNRKVWYHQIWIPSNLYFIVSDLMYIPR